MAKLLGEMTIDGRPCRVVENLGFRGGYWVKMVIPASAGDSHRDRLAIVSRRRDGPWRFWTPEDRLR